MQEKKICMLEVLAKAARNAQSDSESLPSICLWKNTGARSGQFDRGNKSRITILYALIKQHGYRGMLIWAAKMTGEAYPAYAYNVIRVRGQANDS